tara:strand:+ start:15029 stop:15595 length:567 start_codon:yes stop_codon:yes gene_type:complete
MIAGGLIGPAGADGLGAAPHQADQLLDGDVVNSAAPSGCAIAQHHDLRRNINDFLQLVAATFEMEMVRIAARKRTPEDVADLHQILTEQEAARLVSAKFLEIDGRFHLRIAEISGNPIFASLGAALFAWLAEFHFDLVRSPGLEQLTLAEHSQIVDAIEKGDPQTAAKVTGDHLNRANTLYNRENFRR